MGGAESVVGVDSSQKSIEQAKRKHSHRQVSFCHVGDYKRVLTGLGAEVVRESGFMMLWALPTTRWVVVRKPA